MEITINSITLTADQILILLVASIFVLFLASIVIGLFRMQRQFDREWQRIEDRYR